MVDKDTRLNGHQTISTLTISTPPFPNKARHVPCLPQDLAIFHGQCADVSPATVRPEVLHASKLYSVSRSRYLEFHFQTLALPNQRADLTTDPGPPINRCFFYIR